MEQQTIILALKNAKNAIFAKYPIKELAIFGSVARNQYDTKSDVDIMVEFSQPVGFEFIDLAEDLENILHKKIDLVSKKGIKPQLWPFIQKDLIYV